MECKIVADGRHYGRKTGTVRKGAEVTMLLFVPRRLGAMEVHLNLRLDQEEYYFRSELTWQGMEKDMDIFTCRFPAQTIGLYWYYFDLDGDGGTWFSTLSGRKASFIREISGKKDFQLTIYERSYEKPAFLPGGLFYHVFIDRFNRGTEGRNAKQSQVEREIGLCRKDPVKSRYYLCSAKDDFDNQFHRTLTFHENWEEEPVWQEDRHGEILNNDFFGGDLEGIREKIPYFKKLGVTCLYLSPIFEAYSNHKYDTGNYQRIDALFGDEEDFRRLCKEAEDAGISVILDGVFNHTGSDSIYFNKYGIYDSNGAWNGNGSPYRSWYTFSPDGTRYRSWWGIDTLPTVEKEAASYQEYLFGEDGVIRRWIRMGAAGWRLDVVDELPDPFLKKLVKAAKTEREDAVVLGEVWEDASNKTAYSVRREYFQGEELDSVMNYPWKDAIIRYLTEKNAGIIADSVDEIICHYPKEVMQCLMNPLGTHDSMRILTALAGPKTAPQTRKDKAAIKLSARDRARGIRLMKMAVLLQMILPGVPCIYYGDETGMEGYQDPFNRRTYPWGREDRELQNRYFMLTDLRKRNRSFFAEADYEFLYAENGVYLFARTTGDKILICGTNRGEEAFRLPVRRGLELYIPHRYGMLLEDISRQDYDIIRENLEEWRNG